MYAIYIDNQPVYVPGSQSQLLLDPILDEAMGTNGNLTFGLPTNNPFYDSVVEMKSKVVLKQDGKERWAGRVLTAPPDWYNTKSVTCEGELGYFWDSLQRPFDEDLQDRGYIIFLVDEHNRQVDESMQFVVGNVTVTMETEETDRINEDYKKTREIFDDLASKYGGYFVVRKENGIRYIDYIAEYTNVATQPLVFGRNIIDLKRESKASDIKTAIVPLGASLGSERVTIEDVNGGLDYIQNDEAVEQYGFIIDAVTFDDVEDEDELLVRGREKLAELSSPAITVDSTAVDLSIMPNGLEPYRAGDKVSCKSPPHKLDTVLQVNSLRLAIAEPEKTEIVLGADVPTSTSRSTNVASKVKVLEKAVSEIGEPQPGPPGPEGRQGPVYTPSVNTDGVISWTNNGGLPNPSIRNITGPQGPKGDTGADWILEAGIIDGWSYEKWNSGKAVIWIARLNITFPAATAWGSTGINKQIGSFSFPDIFINAPLVYGSIAGAMDVTAAPRVYALSATTGEAEHLRRTASAGTTGYSILAIGQWK